MTKQENVRDNSSSVVHTLKKVQTYNGNYRDPEAPH